MQRFFKSKTVGLDKSKTFHEPPIKVIRALSGFRSNDESRISFEKGDYFYVTSFNLQSPNIYHVVNPQTNVSGVVDARYFENLDRKTALPSPPVEIKTDYDEQLQRSSKPMFNYLFPGKLRTGNMRKGSVSSIVTSHSILSPARAQGFEMNENYNQMFYSRRSEMGNGSQLPFNSVEKESSIIDLRRQEHPSESSFSLIKVDYVMVLDNINDKYSVILNCENGRSRMIHRSYAELYSLHLQLLEMFPGDAGVDFSPRVIPFLSPLSNYDLEKKTMGTLLETYMIESMQLPNSILNSRYWIEFLNLRPGDEELGESQMNNENSILDYLEEYDKPTIIKVKISLGTGQTYSFKAEQHSSHRALIKSLEARLQRTLNDLFYWDEHKRLMRIHGDKDLQLLFRTCPKPTLYSK